MDGIFSVKSDVFSFGVIVLETVSGRKNRGIYNYMHHKNLIGYVSLKSLFKIYFLLHFKYIYVLCCRCGAYGRRIKH